MKSIYTIVLSVIFVMTSLVYGVESFTSGVGRTSEDQDKISAVSCTDSTNGYNDTDFTNGVSSALLTTCSVKIYEPGVVTIMLTSQNYGLLRDSAGNGTDIPYSVTVQAVVSEAHLIHRMI